MRVNICTKIDPEKLNRNIELYENSNSDCKYAKYLIMNEKTVEDLWKICDGVNFIDGNKGLNLKCRVIYKNKKIAIDNGLGFGEVEIL